MAGSTRRFLALGVAALVLGVAPQAAVAHPHSGDGRIAYATQLPGGGARITVANPDGSDAHVVPLGDPAEDFATPVWSPDGSRLLISNMIAFDDQGGFVGFRPATVAPDGSRYRLIARPDLPVDMFCHGWTGDGRRLLCGIGFAAPGIFSVRSTDGGDPRRLTTNPFGDNDAPWSVAPDGSRFAFLRFRPASAPDAVPFRPEAVEIFTERVDGSGLRRVVPYGYAEPHEIASASWSPDGRWILSSTVDGRLFVVDTTGGAGHEIVLAGGQPDDFAFEPTWSPDGRRIAFSMFRDGQPDLFVVRTDGSHLVQITNTPEFEDGVAWTGRE